MIKVLLDSSIWLSSLLREDDNHKNAKKILKTYLTPNYQIIIPQPVLVEIINVLNREQWSLKEILDFINKAKSLLK